MGIKLSTEEARWGIREAAWGLEERVIWRGSDVARAALRRALQAVAPLQRLIQTRLVWPLEDRLDDYGAGTRTGLATLGVAAALGAGVAGAAVAGSDQSPSTHVAAARAAAAAHAATAPSLQGVVPDFAADPNVTAASATEAAPPLDAAGPVADDAPPDQVAWRFAQAFVAYEVGELDAKATETFKASATRPLAAALRTDPPRLPESSKVPEARVLNIVLGEQSGKQLTASVSLLRLQAASELRLTLRETKQGWRVAGVLG